MSKLSSAAACGLVFTVFAAQAAGAAVVRTGTCVDSPRAVLTVCVAADARGPYYQVYRGQRTVITHARLGLVLDGFAGIFVIAGSVTGDKQRGICRSGRAGKRVFRNNFAGTS